MVDKTVGKVTVKEVFSEPVTDGAVFVYKIEKDKHDNDIFFDDFYIATFDSISNEIVWGVGFDIQSALENAERNWDRLGEDEGGYPNPFREALEKLNEKDNNMLLNY